MKNFDGKIVMAWKSKTGRYFAKVQYWVGAGFQNVMMEITHGQYEGFLIDNE